MSFAKISRTSILWTSGCEFAYLNIFINSKNSQTSLLENILSRRLSWSIYIVEKVVKSMVLYEKYAVAVLSHFLNKYHLLHSNCNVLFHFEAFYQKI